MQSTWNEPQCASNANQTKIRPQRRREGWRLYAGVGDSNRQQYMNAMHNQKNTWETQWERARERHAHTHTITERYTEQHTRHYKSHLRVPATLGLHFLECRTNCLHLSWNIFMCWTSTCTPACMYGGGVEPWYCNQSLMTGCYLTPTSTWTRSSELAGLFLNTRTVSVIHSSIVGKVWEQLQCFNCASRDFTKRFYTKHSPGIPISLKGIITSHCVFF